MSDTNIEVRISADSTDLKGGMEQGAQHVQASTKDMTEAFKQMDAQVMATLADMNKTVNSAMSGVAETFKRAQSVLLAFTAVAAGGAAFKSVINASTEWTGEVSKLSKALGITTERASVLNVALNHLGISSEQYTDAAFAMSRQLSTHGEAFAKMGVQVKDATGDYRPITEVMSEVNQKLIEIQDPIEQNIDGAKVYGKQWKELKPILKLNAEQMKESEKRARELGLIVGPEGEAQAKQYKAQMRDLTLVGKSLEIQFGNTLVPIFTNLGSWFASEGPTAAKIFGDALKYIADFGLRVYYTLQGLGTVIAGVMAAANEAIHGNLSGAKTVIKDMMDDVDALGEKANKAIAKLYAAPNPTSDTKKKKGPHYGLGDKEEKDKQDPGRAPAWEAELAKLRDNYAKAMDSIGSMRQLSLQNEADYWSAILNKSDLTANERIAAEKKLYAANAQLRKDKLEAKTEEMNASKAMLGKNFEARIAIAQKAYDKIAEAYGAESKEAAKAYGEILKERQALADQISKIDQAHAEAKQKRDEAEIDSQQRIAMIEADAYGASAQEKIKIEQQYLDKRYALDIQDMERRLATVDKDRNPEEYQKLLDQKLAMEAQYHNKVRELDAQFAAANPMTTVFNDMQTSFATAITNMITHAQTLRQSLAAIFNSVLQSFTQQMIAEPLAMMAMRAIRETSIYQAMFAQKKTLEVADAAQQIATQKMAGIAGITSNAALAATAAMASVAAIPVVGWAMAPEVGLETYATAMAYLPSAEGGFDIPAGVNPLTQLHEKEMVLPAEHAETIRNMGGGGETHVHVHALDAHDLRSYLRRGGADEIVKALAERSRNGG